MKKGNTINSIGVFREDVGYDTHGNVTSIARYRRITSSSYGLMDYNQDLLGNIREVVDSAGTVKQITHYYPFGAPYADPAAVMNASHQPYKYNGKELDRMHGLDTYDYGARQYDPILGRWDRIDPLCEKYYSVSPYAYCANNPVSYIDPDGRDGVISIYGENITIRANVYLYGSGATKTVMRQMQNDINKVWGKDYSVEHNGSFRLIYNGQGRLTKALHSQFIIYEST